MGIMASELLGLKVSHWSKEHAVVQISCRPRTWVNLRKFLQLLSRLYGCFIVTVSKLLSLCLSCCHGKKNTKQEGCGEKKGMGFVSLVLGDEAVVGNQAMMMTDVSHGVS